jgi:hypothetical protein
VGALALFTMAAQSGAGGGGGSRIYEVR